MKLQNLIQKRINSSELESEINGGRQARSDINECKDLNSTSVLALFHIILLCNCIFKIKNKLN